MPSLYYLNTPPHPFWDFVAGIEDHPFLSQRGGQPSQPAEQAQAQGATAPSSSEKAKGKQPEANVEDPPEIDPSSVRPDRKDMPFRGRGRFSNAFDSDENSSNKEKNDKGEDCHRGKRGCHGRRGGHEGGGGPWSHRGGPPFGPPPFMFGGNFPFGPHGPFGRPEAPGHEGHSGPPPHWFRGRGGPHRGPPRWGGHHGHHGPHSRSPPRGQAPGESSGFDLASFLSNLGERLGMDLTSAAQGLGLSQPRSTETDFEPRTDIFDTASEYVIHLSLPGAKKSDVGVDWDGEHSQLRIAGVVHRPNVDEALLSHLVVDGRKRETGVFEKMIRLGTPRQPANVDVSGIVAKMVDGVLVVRVPKVEKTYEKKEVHIDETSPSPERPEDAYMNEKDLLFDADDAEEDRDMYDAEATPAAATAAESKRREAEQEALLRDDRSETVGREHPIGNANANATTETLPRYQVDEPHESKLAKEHSHDGNLSDWEKDGSEDEGEYVKINVD